MDPLPKDGESAAGGEPSRGAAPSSGVVVQVREKKGPLRAAIPYMPFPVAVICLFLNTFVPGLGKELRRRPGRERAPAESFATGAALRVPPDGRAPGLRRGEEGREGCRRSLCGSQGHWSSFRICARSWRAEVLKDGCRGTTGVLFFSLRSPG